MKIKNNLSDIYRKDVIKESKLMKQWIAWFDSFKVNPLLSYFTQNDIAFIHKLATSPAMHCNVKEKYRLLGELMNRRGFSLIGGGTNRRAYVCNYDKRVVAKVATDNVGFTSNLKEYVNQNVLKPFCNKIFEVSPCGSLAIIENVIPIKDVSEFTKYSQEIFDILYFKIRNNNIAMDDIGTRSMKNWGYRSGFGPVLLDYPSMYVADPKKRLCKDILNGKLCSGTLDYDEGFNNIVCSECGRTYLASTLSKPEGDDIKSLLSAVGYKKNEGVKKMKIIISSVETGEVISVKETGGKSNHVDSSISNLNNNVNHVFDTHINSAPKKKRRVIITPINNNEETTVNNIVEEVKVEPAKPVVVVGDKKANFMNAFNKLNAGLTFEQAVNSSNVPVTNLIKAINSMIITDNPFVSEEEAFRMYREVNAATINSYGECVTITEDNVGTADTMLNAMLRKISGAEMNEDMFLVFYKLILNVKNTKTFFMSIINFWKLLLELNSFDTDENSDVFRFCIYKDVYDVYRSAIGMSLEDYRYNIVLSGNFTYNSSNILKFISSAVSNMKFASESGEYDFEVDTNKYYTISLAENYAEQVYCETVQSDETSVEDIINDINASSEDDNTCTVEEGYDVDEEETSEPEPKTVPEKISIVDQYNMAVIGNEKQGTRKQQQKYGKKKKKNRRR